MQANNFGGFKSQHGLGCRIDMHEVTRIIRHKKDVAGGFDQIVVKGLEIIDFIVARWRRQIVDHFSHLLHL